MIHRNFSTLLAALVWLALLMAACQPAGPSVGAVTEPPPSPTPVPPTATPAPTDTPAPAATPTPTHTLAPTATPAPTHTPAPTAAPAATATPVLRSGEGNAEVTLTFTNNTDDVLKLYWVNFEGDEEPFGEAAPALTIQQETFSTHAWRLRDETGNTVLEIVATEEKTQAFEVGAGDDVAQPAGNPCKLPASASGFGFPRPKESMASTGTVKAVVLFAPGSG